MIEERQEQLNTLYTETFGGDSKPVGELVSDLVLDREAQPPSLKLEELRRRKGFTKTYEHKREDLPSLSEYDLSLANFALREGWSDQEIVDLIVAFRRRHGDEKDLKKALRPDYISGVIAKARYSDALELLPFKVKRLIQLGTEDAEYALELEDGTSINMGETPSFLSPRRANHKLYDAGFALSRGALKRWSEITTALRSLVEVIPTLTRREQIGQWVRDLVTYNTTIVDPYEADSLSRAFSGFGNREQSGVAIDKRGVAYVNLSSSARAMFIARLQLGQGVTQRSISADLANLGFRKLHKVSVHSEEGRRQVNIWTSPEGFISLDFVNGIIEDRKELERMDKERLLLREAESDKDRAMRKAGEELKDEWSPM